MIKCANCKGSLRLNSLNWGGLDKLKWIDRLFFSTFNRGMCHAIDRFEHFSDINGYFLCKACVGDSWFGKKEEKK